MIPLMTELDEPFSRVDGVFKSSVEKLVPIRGLFPILKKSVGYDVVRSYE